MSKYISMVTNLLVHTR